MRTLFISGALAILAIARPAAADCIFAKLGEMKVETRANSVLADVEVNGTKGKMLVHTGSTRTSLTEAGAAKLGAVATTAPTARVFTPRGEMTAQTGRLENLKIGGAFLVPYMEVSIAGKGAQDDEVVGELGLDVLAAADVEIDLANNRIAFYTPKDCAGRELIYWSTRYSLADLKSDLSDPFFKTTVELNGKKVDAEITTTMPYSAVDLTAARAVGVTPRSPQSYALGKGVISRREAWVGVFEAAAIGDEQVRNVRLAFGDLWSDGTSAETGWRINRKVDGFPSMLLGLDFLRAHRVLLAKSQGRMYFTYNGGGIFRPPPASN